MSITRWLKIGFLVGFVVLVASYVFFALTGGHGLSRVVWHYFIRDLPDKKYSWREFGERGASKGISGFYAYGDQDGFSMWTLSGLKTFTHAQGTSIYMHEDICGAMARLSDKSQEIGGSVLAGKEVTGNIELWQSLIKQENLVTVVRLSTKEYDNGVDKVWSYSGRYKILNRLDGEACK